MHNTIHLIILSFLLTSLSCSDKHTKTKTNSDKNVQFKWKAYRGVNVGCEIDKTAIEALSESGANLIRLSMPLCNFMNLDAPYDFRPEAFQKLDSVLDWGEEYGISVLIDPHRYPGTKHQWTMLGNDPFWQDFKWHDLLIQFWDSVATRYSHKGAVIAGYDLLNEPEVPFDMQKGSPQDLGLLYKKLTEAIRKKDSTHTIVYALPRIYNRHTKQMLGYHKGIDMIPIPEDDNRCIETHTYFPKEFTHQNIWEPGIDIPYPVTLDTVLWNREQMELEQAPLIEFSKKNPETAILVGEFSAPRWTDEHGMRYLEDVIEIAEKYQWSWAYHSFREARVWDPEMSISDRNDSTRSSQAPRWKLLKKYFKRNGHD